MQPAYVPIGPGAAVAHLGVDRRAEFIARTYGHLLGALVAFVGLEVVFFASGVAVPLASAMLGVSWLWVLGGFVLLSWMARGVARSADSLAAQYAALAVYVAGEALIFVPLLVIAQSVAPGTIQSAALITLLGAGGLTAVAFATRRDFSFLRGILAFAGVLALVAIVGGVLFGFQLGTWFSVAMIGLAGAAVLYDTSNVLLHYSENRYVSAALELFASIALMFWYVLRLLMRSRD